MQGKISAIWIAAEVRSQREFAVAAALRSKGYETFVPAYRTRRRWSDRLKTVELPLISGYVFVQMALEGAKVPIVTTPGVIRLVGFNGHVAEIADEEIEAIRAVTNSSLRVESWSYIKPNATVRIAHGSLSGVRGTVLKITDKTLLIISIEILQRSVAVHIDRSWVEVMPS